MSPELSAVMIAGSIRRRAELCLSRLLAQTALDRMEIVVVDLETEGRPPAGIEHAAVRYVRMPAGTPYSIAQAECVRQARGEIIAFIEDHCYPSHGWAASILNVFSETRASIVTYGFKNYNPERYLSRAFFVTEYGRWMCPVRQGPVSIPSCNNVAYRRAELEQFAPELDRIFDAEFLMQRRIIARGGRAWIEPGAEVAHENWESLITGISCNHAHRRMGAAHRTAGWSHPRKCCYAGAMAVTPLLHLWRLAFSLRNRPSLWTAFLSALPVSISVYISTAYAEVVGCLFGPGFSGEIFTAAELNSPRKSLHTSE